MAVYTGPHDWGCSETKCFELGSLSDRELSLFSTLINHRRPLPVCLGDIWRCDACEYECRDIAEMADHILQTHRPEPMNSEDWVELLGGDTSSDGEDPAAYRLF